MGGCKVKPTRGQNKFHRELSDVNPCGQLVSTSGANIVQARQHCGYDTFVVHQQCAQMDSLQRKLL
eukprot:1386567-Amphidinium_carterae.1